VSVTLPPLAAGTLFILAEIKKMLAIMPSNIGAGGP
jgi:hypothetical protein